MSPKPILLIGGSGVIGRRTARSLRDAHPDVPLLIGRAEDVALDLSVDDLGLGERPVGAVAVLPKDDRVAARRRRPPWSGHAVCRDTSEGSELRPFDVRRRIVSDIDAEARPAQDVDSLRKIVMPRCGSQRLWKWVAWTGCRTASTDISRAVQY